jgi:hypothetical protein
MRFCINSSMNSLKTKELYFALIVMYMKMEPPLAITHYKCRRKSAIPQPRIFREQMREIKMVKSFVLWNPKFCNKIHRYALQTLFLATEIYFTSSQQIYQRSSYIFTLLVFVYVFQVIFLLEVSQWQIHFQVDYLRYLNCKYYTYIFEWDENEIMNINCITSLKDIFRCNISLFFCSVWGNPRKIL